MPKIYWIGPRESDVLYGETLFSGSATFYGSNTNGNSAFCGYNEVRINHNIDNQAASDFILNWQLEKIKEDPTCLFMSYNPNCAYGAPKEVISRSLCLNDETLMQKLENKTYFRELIRGIGKVLPYCIISGQQCDYDTLKRITGFNTFVIQEPVSSGGEGTFLMTEKTAAKVYPFIRKEETYLVSQYAFGNIPVNLHAIIFDHQIIFFPGSVQIVQEGNYHLLYRGADYCAFSALPGESKELFYSQSLRLLEKVQTMGYRGIIGVDAMLIDGQVYFTELNNRFQGSSLLLGKSLHESGLPSLQQLNLDAFSGKTVDSELSEKLKDLSVPYSMYTYVNEGDCLQANHILSVAGREKWIRDILTEGYDPQQEAEPYAYLFSAVFEGNIASAFQTEGKVRIHPNLPAPSKKWLERIFSGDLTALKTALINRGVVLTDKAKDYIHRHGDMREGTYLSLDIFIRGIYINSPLYVRLTRLSPFLIDVDPRDGLVLEAYGKRIAPVDYDRKISAVADASSGQLQIDSVLFFATDRLRIQNNSYCTFVKHNVACKFCEANQIQHTFTSQDILDSIDALFRNPKRPEFRHILIGGLSNEIGCEQGAILKICERIRRYTDMPIYLMCLPPTPSDVRRYYDAGVTEFGFNIEVYNREVARQLMPGKGAIPLKRYIDALKQAVECCGANGLVRSAFIVGLEPVASLYEGIEAVCRIGAAPVLSAFRPIPGTELENIIPLSDDELYEITNYAEKICNHYGLTLGPTCPACRNNTLTVARENEVKAIYSSLWRREKHDIKSQNA